MDDKLQELNFLSEFIREHYSAIGISLDYSLESLKILDKLFDDEYKNGALIHPASSFAEKEGMILTGVAGYLANVMIKYSPGSQIIIDPADENWYMTLPLNQPMAGHRNQGKEW